MVQWSQSFKSDKIILNVNRIDDVGTLEDIGVKCFANRECHEILIVNNYDVLSPIGSPVSQNERQGTCYYKLTIMHYCKYLCVYPAKFLAGISHFVIPETFIHVTLAICRHIFFHLYNRTTHSHTDLIITCTFSTRLQSWQSCSLWK